MKLQQKYHFYWNGESDGDTVDSGVGRGELDTTGFLNFTLETAETLSAPADKYFTLSRETGEAQADKGEAGKLVIIRESIFYICVFCILVGDIITSDGDMSKEREEKLLNDAFAYCGSRKDAN